MTPRILPTIRTERLVLRPFELADAPRVQALAGDRAVAGTTLTLPHPYEDGMAEAWIATHAPDWEAGARMALAVTTEADGVVGAIGLVLTPAHGHGEIGYWVGVPFWGRGIATEAARAVVAHAFGALGLHRVLGRCFARNAASGRVLRRAGMAYEGTLRQHLRRWDRFEDVEVYGILADEWRARGGDSAPDGRGS